MAAKSIKRLSLAQIDLVRKIHFWTRLGPLLVKGIDIAERHLIAVHHDRAYPSLRISRAMIKRWI